MSFKRSPPARRDDTHAIGNPVAFEASADERDVLGFISIATILSSKELCANCMLVPPITPIASTILYEYSCSLSWTSFDMVSIGAEQKESPVCTPMGSMFSIKHTVIMLFSLSRTTSSSSSSQPITDFSIRIWPIRLAVMPRAAVNFNSSSLKTVPPPVPPMV